MPTISVLDPTARPPEKAGDRGPDLGPLRGKRFGFRTDSVWRSWEWTIDEWTRLILAAGAVVRVWRAPSRTGVDAAAKKLELEAFVGSVDIIAVGLGN